MLFHDFDILCHLKAELGPVIIFDHLYFKESQSACCTQFSTVFNRNCLVPFTFKYIPVSEINFTIHIIQHHFYVS